MTANLPADSLNDFSLILSLAFLSPLDGYEAYAGAILPVLYDTLKEEYERKDSLCRVIERNARR